MQDFHPPLPEALASYKVYIEVEKNEAESLLRLILWGNIYTDNRSNLSCGMANMRLLRTTRQ